MRKTSSSSRYVLYSILMIFVVGVPLYSLVSQEASNSRINNQTVFSEISDDDSGDGNVEYPKKDIQITQRVSYLLPALELNDLIQQSSLIVVGEAVGESDPFLVEPLDGGDDRFFHDVYIAIDAIVDGDPSFDSQELKNKSIIYVRVMGGEGTYMSTVNDSSPDFKIGSTYLLFLCQYDDGLNYNTYGEHYYVVGTCQGLWERLDDGSFGAGKFFDYEPKTISYEDLSALVMEQTEDLSPAGEDDLTDYQRWVQDSYENGELDDDMYELEKERADDAASRFCRVLSKEEQLAYEEEMLEENSNMLVFH